MTHTGSKWIAFVVLLLALGSDARAALIVADVVFPAALTTTQMTIAYDGTNYWSTTGGSNTGVREAQYDSAGNVLNTYSPGLDFRSIFTDAAGNVYARTFSSPTIYRQTSPGVFAPFATLTGGLLDPQSSVVLNGAGTEYVAFNNGTLSRWDLAGNALAAVTFSGFGTMNSESNFPRGRGVAAYGNNYLTYSAGILSTWDASGNRIATDTLVGAGQSFNSYFGFSFANGRAFVVDDAGGNWRGYALGTSVLAVPEPSSLALALLGGVGALGWSRRRARRAR